VAPGGTVHAVSRCASREFDVKTTGDFWIRFGHLGQMSKAYEVRLYAYTLMSNHARWGVRIGSSPTVSKGTTQNQGLTS
jgi:hypothetical protein